MTIVEICVENLDGVRAAVDAGADRVELCSRLDVGGLTPDLDDVRGALAIAPPGGVAIMIRPREGNFEVYYGELDVMLTQIVQVREIAEAAGAEARISLVFGVLRDQEIDEISLAALMEAAGPVPVCFHRAFDEVADRARGIEILKWHGVNRILTAGGPGNADAQNLRETLESAGDGIGVLACGGLRETNVAEIIFATGVTQVHMRAPLGDTNDTDPALARAIVERVRSIAK